MNAIAIAVAASALGVSLFAALLAVGAVLRVQRMERAAATLPGLATGAAAPLQALAGSGTAVDHALAQPEQFVVFLSSACGPCRDAVEALNNDDVRGQLPAGLILVEVGATNRSELRGVATFPAAWVADDGAVAKAFAVHAFPFAFVIREGRVSDAGLANAMIRVPLAKSREPTTAPRLGW